MLNRQQLIHNELEQLHIQNQQKDELIMMLLSMNKQNQLNDYQYQNNSLNHGFLNHNYNHNIHLGNKHISNNHIGMNSMQAHQLNSIPNLPQNMLPSIPQNVQPIIQQNMPSHYSQQSVQQNHYNNMNNRINNNNNFYMNQGYNPSSETNLQLQDQRMFYQQDNNHVKNVSMRDSDAKKNQDLSDFSMQHEESNTRISLTRNSFGAQQTQSTSNHLSQQPNCDSLFTQNILQQLPSQSLIQKIEQNHSSDMNLNTITSGTQLIYTSGGNFKDYGSNRNSSEENIQLPYLLNQNSNYFCGYKYISKGENTSNLMSKIQKNPTTSRLADFLTYTYTFEPSLLEKEGVLENIFNNKSQEENQDKNINQDINKTNLKQMPLNTTVIQLNNKESELDNLGCNVNAGYFCEQKSFTNKDQKSQQVNKINQQKEISFNQEISIKPNMETKQNNNKFNIKDESLSQYSNEDSLDIIEEGIAIQNEKQLKKSQSSLRINQKVTETVENFLKSKLKFISKEDTNKDEIDPYYNRQRYEQQGKTQKSFQNLVEKVKGMKGQVDFEDVTSLISLETNINEDALKKEVQQILHHFKSNHKVYFKKVRSQKEMLKDTKFHNLNKRIMRVLLSILNNPVILSLKVPKPMLQFFNVMSQRLVNSSKKLIKNTIVNDQYSHAHYNTMFLQISAQNYQKLNQSASDVELHRVIYNIDLTLPYNVNYYQIQKTNILKQYIFLILDRTLRLNDTSKDSQIQAIRSMYIERVIKGMEKMNEGKIVQRF